MISIPLNTAYTHTPGLPVGESHFSIHCAASPCAFRKKVMVETVNYIYGLAGRDFTVEHVRGVFAELEKVAQGTIKAPNHKYIGLRE